MSRAAPSTAGSRSVTFAIVAVGAALLLMRLWLPVLDATPRVIGLVAALVAILTASLIVRVPADRARLRAPLVLAIGLAGVGLALVAGGRPVPTSYVAWALPLSLLAAVSEEALFRRAAYGALQHHGALVAIGVTALAFALIHVPLYGVAVLPVDLGAGLLLSWQRWAAGTWTVPAATHGAANVLMTVLR